MLTRDLLYSSPATMEDQHRALDDPLDAITNINSSPLEPLTFSLGRFPFEVREKVIKDAAIAAYPGYSDDDPRHANHSPFLSYSLLLVSKQFNKLVTPYRWWVRWILDSVPP